MKHWTQIGVLLSTLLVLMGAQAAEAPADAQAEGRGPTEVDAADSNAPATSQDPAAGEDNDVFVPSVEVSEDRSVPFPVDI